MIMKENVLKVLIVEDEIRIREGLGKLLSRSGGRYDVVMEAGNGVEGLQAILQLKPDIVITDIRMPDMDGLEMLEQMVQAGIHTKAIVLSAFSEFEYARSAMKLGVTEYLLKPIAYNELMQSLENVTFQIEKERLEKPEQIGTPEDIYNEPKNAFVADFIGESNIFNGMMTGKLRARFCGGEFECVDDYEEGTHITAVVRPEDVELTRPELGVIQGVVDSVIFKGMHYEITVLSGKNEIVSQTVHSAKVGDHVGIRVEPDNIHIMLAEDHTNFFFADINKDFKLEYNEHLLDTSVTKIIKGSSRREDGTLQDANGEAVDPGRVRIQVAIGPSDIQMTDDQDAGLVKGTISNLIYKGDHYSYVIHTELEQDFVVNDEYLWNLGDSVSLLMPIDKMTFTIKKK